jgi:hypothetical protein
MEYLAQCKGDARNLEVDVKTFSREARGRNTLSSFTSAKDDPSTDALHTTGDTPTEEL